MFHMVSMCLLSDYNNKMMTRTQKVNILRFTNDGQKIQMDKMPNQEVKRQSNIMLLSLQNYKGHVKYNNRISC